MSNEYAGLASAVDKFKDAVKKELEKLSKIVK
jgi:hypothetical protein